jgi:hypothetical protein
MLTDASACIETADRRGLFLLGVHADV